MKTQPTPAQPPRPRRARPAFTLLEMILAASLAAIIAAACIGLYTTIARADEISRLRTEAIVDMSRVHQAMQRAARTMLLDDRPPPAKNEQRQARIALIEAANGPRLELTLMRPPVLGLIAGKPMDPTARHTPMAGAFELRAAPINPRAKSRADLSTAAGMPQPAPELELWWTPYPPGSRSARSAPDGSPEGILVSAGIRTLDIAFAKTGENKQLDRFRTGEITDWNNIPAFLEVNIEMLDGQKASWMLEVAAQGGKMPGTAGAGDSDLPVALIERLRTETDIAVPPTAGGTSTSGGNNSSNADTNNPGSDNANPGSNTGDSGSGNTRPPRDAAEEARRLAEAFDMLNRLLQQLSGGGGGGGGDE